MRQMTAEPGSPCYATASSSTETMHRYHRRSVRAAPGTVPILDGTLIPVDRVAAQKAYRSGKHKRHG
jgi:hypothetical protein